MKNLIAAITASALFCAPAVAQNFNVDLNATFGTPSNTYGAAASQAGTWNTLTTTGPSALLDTSGGATGVTATANQFFLFSFNNAGTAGDDEMLMDDGADGARTWTFSGLANGSYDIYTYAWAPDSATFLTNVSVNGSASQTVGGPWPGSHALGVTYALHTTNVTTGQVLVTLTVQSGFATTNGFQIRPSGPVPSGEYNIDLNNAAGTPTSAYGAAAAQPGTWNSMTSAGPVNLTDTAGLPSTVSAAANTYIPFNFNNAGTAGDDQALMDDVCDGARTWTFSNLPNGTYDVYTYAWAPDSATFFTSVSVNGGAGQTVGGAWPGSHVQGVTYAKDTVTISGGTITVAMTVSSGFSSTNGFQLVKGTPPPPPAGTKFNIDVNNVFGTPTSAYGAAAAQAGVWNSITSIGPVNLTDIGGTATSVTATGSSYISFSFNNAGTVGDDEALMDDICDGNRTWTFAGLPNGTYDVYTYAWAPDSATFSTSVSVNGGPGQTVGGAWGGSHALGVTYALHNVTISTGTITVDMSVSSGFTSTNGFQIVGQGACAAPTTYCTAKTTSSGCVPTIGFTGTPTPAGNLTATCTQVEANQLGVLFYGQTGPAAIPFQGGTLCVNPPVIRFPPQPSGGAAACSGTYSQSLSSLTGTPGLTFHSQFWFRDPGAATGTGLSNGLTWTNCP